MFLFDYFPWHCFVWHCFIVTHHLLWMYCVIFVDVMGINKKKGKSDRHTSWPCPSDWERPISEQREKVTLNLLLPFVCSSVKLINQCPHFCQKIEHISCYFPDENLFVSRTVSREVANCICIPLCSSPCFWWYRNRKSSTRPSWSRHTAFVSHRTTFRFQIKSFSSHLHLWAVNGFKGSPCLFFGETGT